MMRLIVEGTTSKQGNKRPYLARIGQTMNMREFCGHEIISQQMRRFVLDVAPGDVVDGRAKQWNPKSQKFEGGHFHGMIVDGGMVKLPRIEIDLVLHHRREGWRPVSIVRFDRRNETAIALDNMPARETPYPPAFGASQFGFLATDGDITRAFAFQTLGDAPPAVVRRRPNCFPPEWSEVPHCKIIDIKGDNE